MPPSDPTPDSNLDFTEANMRRALGLGDGPHGAASGRPEPHRPRPDAHGPERTGERPPERALAERGQAPDRHTGDRHGSDRHGSDRHTGDRHRTRFVQDGDVPVTMVSRHRPNEAATAGPPGRGGVADPALAGERAARERAERALAEALATIRDLRTKQAHAELAWQEAQAAARAGAEARERQLGEELAGERALRAQAVHAQAEAETARDVAQKALETALDQAARAAAATGPTFSEPAFGSPAPGGRLGRRAAGRGGATPAEDAPHGERTQVQASDAAPHAPTLVRRARKNAAARAQEPQPVKWWIRTPADR